MDPHWQEQERPPADPLLGMRVYSWVLVLSGNREVPENFFIDPLTGISYNTTDENFLGIESIWNHENYWVNMQDCRFGCAVSIRFCEIIFKITGSLQSVFVSVGDDLWLERSVKVGVHVMRPFQPIAIRHSWAKWRRSTARLTHLTLSVTDLSIFWLIYFSSCEGWIGWAESIRDASILGG